MRVFKTHRKLIALVALVAISTIGAGVNKCSDDSPARKLLKAEDDAAVMVQKLEQARTLALNSGHIDQATATRIDRQLLRINTQIKHVSAAGDAFVGGTGDAEQVRSAIAVMRDILDGVILAINNGQLGIQNPDTRKSLVALLNSLKQITTVVENVSITLETERSK